MTTFIAIAGSPKMAFTVLKKSGDIARLDPAAMATLKWAPAAATKTPTAFASLTTDGATSSSTPAAAGRRSSRRTRSRSS